MEFLRYGSRIPGAYQWGCCAVCIIQDFKQDPDDKASIQLVSGDSGMPLQKNGESAFLGTTYKEIFDQRLRIGTFSATDMPNHVFFAVLTADQLRTTIGLKWLKILKEAGFEFIRATDNSVYTGQALAKDIGEQSCEDPDYCDDCDCGYYSEESHINYVFGLFRNIGVGRVENPFTPPDAWLALEGTFSEVNQKLSEDEQVALEKERYDYHLSQWDKIGPIKQLTRQEVIDAGAPVILAGLFSDNPQEEESVRQKKQEEAKTGAKADQKASPWSV
jgi:hypothetical protein